MNDPLRAERSAVLVSKALDMLLEIHRTGALFFDDAWVDATLRGHSSHQVAAAVASFVDTLPADYPPRLRALVLQKADLLMRAARTRAP